jgi:hypothetical protein
MRPSEVFWGGFFGLEIEISKAPFPGCLPMDNLNAQHGFYFYFFDWAGGFMCRVRK